MKRFVSRLFIGAAIAGVAFSNSAFAGPNYTFSLSAISDPAISPGPVGTVILTQLSSTQVGVVVDLNPAGSGATFGLINTGGPHTPFAFQLSGALAALTATFTNPAGGTYSSGSFTLNTAGGSNTPYGAYNVAIDSSAGNGTANAFFGDLAFTLARASGLDTNDFITNTSGYYFSADVTNGAAAGGRTGAVAAPGRSTPTVPVPEPMSLALFGAGLLGLGLVRRR